MQEEWKTAEMCNHTIEQRSKVRLEEGRKERRRDRYCMLTENMNNGDCFHTGWLNLKKNVSVLYITLKYVLKILEMLTKSV